MINIVGIMFQWLNKIVGSIKTDYFYSANSAISAVDKRRI
jgi:hypothetical protein